MNLDSETFRLTYACRPPIVEFLFLVLVRLKIRTMCAVAILFDDYS